MSFEQSNAENRNAGIMLPTRRCCSFCRNPGHFIRNCNDIRLQIFENNCINQFIFLNSNIELFTGWLLEYSLRDINLIRAYAASRCSLPLRANIDVIVNTITNRINLNINVVTRRNRIMYAQEGPPAEAAADATPAPPQEPRSQQFQIELIGQLLLPNFNRSRNLEDLLLGMMFAEMIGAMRDDITNNRKFSIETKIVECQQSEECDCNICYENYMKNTFVKLNCGHEFCKECMKQSLKNVRTERPQCAFCRAEIKNFELSSEEIREEFNELLS